MLRQLLLDDHRAAAVVAEADVQVLEEALCLLGSIFGWVRSSRHTL